jgi:uncharacterized protein with PQ loop repeat
MKQDRTYWQSPGVVFGLGFLFIGLMRLVGVLETMNQQELRATMMIVCSIGLYYWVYWLFKSNEK